MSKHEIDIMVRGVQYYLTWSVVFLGRLELVVPAPVVSVSPTVVAAPTPVVPPVVPVVTHAPGTPIGRVHESTPVTYKQIRIIMVVSNQIVSKLLNIIAGL